MRYDIPVWQMVREAAKELPEPFTPADIIRKVREKRPNVNPNTIRTQVIACSPNHTSIKHYSTRQKLFYYLGEARFRLLKKGEETPAPSVSEETDEEETERREFSFEFERDLEAHLAKNLNDIDDGLKLYTSSDGKSGRQFEIDGEKIDLLLLDKNDDFVVIEVKPDQATDKACSQILRYMGQVRKRLAGGKKVRGIIICRKATDRLKYAVSVVESVKIKEYEVNFTFHDADLEMD